MASSVRFKYPAKGLRPAIDLIWYDGGIRPPVPDELYEENKELPAEGMMFVGSKGKILAGFNVDNPHLIPEKRMAGIAVPEVKKRERISGFKKFMDAIKAGISAREVSRSRSNHRSHQFVCCCFEIGKTLKYDAANRKITNVAEANKYLSREYRKGWEPESI